MMPAKKLARMVVGNTLRSRRHFVLSAFGIVIGIATFVLFLASTEQVGNVLERIFPLEQVKVIAPHADFIGKDITKKLDDAIVKQIAARPEVALAVPRMAVGFPAAGRGDFQGNDLNFEVGGFADGIDPAFLANSPDAKGDKRIHNLFKDWDADTSDPHRVACTPPPPEAGQPLIQSPAAPPSAGGPPAKPGEYRNPCPDPDEYYCDDTDRTCHHRVPVVMSPTMIELYDSQFASSHGLPQAGTDFVKFFMERGGLSAMRFCIGLGMTTIAGSNTNLAKSAHPRRIEAVLIGLSDKAMPIGMTVPIGYVQRWNREYLGPEAAKNYSSIVVTLKDKAQLAVFAQWLQDKLDLRIEDSLGEKFATAVFVVRLVLVLISLIIIGISAINIAHNFFMQVTERRRELGLLRAIGATKRDVRMVVLGEAALIGLIGGVLGVLLALILAPSIDFVAAHYVPNFPFKPKTWFHFRWWIWSGGLVCAAGFAVLGGYLPARKASNLEPAQALSQN